MKKKKRKKKKEKKEERKKRKEKKIKKTVEKQKLEIFLKLKCRGIWDLKRWEKFSVIKLFEIVQIQIFLRLR